MLEEDLPRALKVVDRAVDHPQAHVGDGAVGVHLSLLGPLAERVVEVRRDVVLTDRGPVVPHQVPRVAQVAESAGPHHLVQGGRARDRVVVELLQ